MNILVIHDLVPMDAPPHSQDTLVQVAAVSEALRSRGHAVTTFAVTLDLDAFDRYIATTRPDVVFNLVESLGGADNAAAAPVALLEARRVPFTGSGTAALALSNDKLVAKTQMKSLAIPTPAWLSLDDVRQFRPGRYIVKAVAEHASFGLDDSAVVDLKDPAQAEDAMRRQSDQLGCICFAECYVDGREFNLSILEDANGLAVLPPAEIDFSAFPPNKPKLVGYAAKWSGRSFEFANTPRRFEFPDDGALRRTLCTLAERTFRAFHTRGYARVDFRVGDAGPQVLELNTNPCLSPDAGYAAALMQADISYAEALERLVQRALGRPAALTRIARAERNAGRIRLRSVATADDVARVRAITADTGFFYPVEVEVAVELVDERLAKGESSGYYFLFADDASGDTIGYASYGPIEMTDGSWDLYWIAVRSNAQGSGTGRALVEAVEQDVRARGGKRIYVETAGRPAYEPTRAFYRRCDYRVEGTFEDFYGAGDAKIVFVKTL
jgi:D-alanine-D-alanine ligase-like ATP-grasp enzyme/GNAT superfamily N-acetyltransferase